MRIIGGYFYLLNIVLCYICGSTLLILVISDIEAALIYIN